jgi:hypothetical protein
MNVGECIKFKGLRVICYGYIININDDSVTYVRDSLTTWDASKSLVDKGELISIDEFIEQVKRNADASPYPVPKDTQVKKLLEEYSKNINITHEEKLKILNIKA